MIDRGVVLLSPAPVVLLRLDRRVNVDVLVSGAPWLPFERKAEAQRSVAQ
jgi:hypothetical protein